MGPISRTSRTRRGTRAHRSGAAPESLAVRATQRVSRNIGQESPPRFRVPQTPGPPMPRFVARFYMYGGAVVVLAGTVAADPIELRMPRVTSPRNSAVPSGVSTAARYIDIGGTQAPSSPERG